MANRNPLDHAPAFKALADLAARSAEANRNHLKLKLQGALRAWHAHADACATCNEARDQRDHSECCPKGDELVSRVDHYAIECDAEVA